MRNEVVGGPGGGSPVSLLLRVLPPALLMGGAVGLRVARAGGGIVALAVTIVATLALLAGLLLLGRWSARRSRQAVLAEHPDAVAVTAAMLVASSVRGRRRALPVVALLFADRLVVEPRSRRKRQAGMGVVELPLASIGEATWSTTVLGARVLTMLRLAPPFGGGPGILLRFDTRREDTVDFVGSVQSALDGWLRDRAPTPPDLDGAASPRSGRTLVVAAACALALGIGGGYSLGLGLLRQQSNPMAIGVAGYSTYPGPDHHPLAIGSPWGTPCKPVVVQPDPSLDPAAYGALAAVVHEARAAGVDIAIADRASHYRLDDLYNTGGSPAGVQVVVAQPAPPALHPQYRDNVGWNAVPAPDGKHDYVVSLVQQLNLARLHGASDLRKAATLLVGYSQGIARSTSPGSAFASTFAQMSGQFTPQDVHAMLVMSGCAGLVAG